MSYQYLKSAEADPWLFLFIIALFSLTAVLIYKESMGGVSDGRIDKEGTEGP